ncbi:MAG TPA: NHL repeat-containing protein [Candidatus Udaeobacter sp.]|jgi:DNA-binding beta-propeller fold protein YncE
MKAKVTEGKFRSALGRAGQFFSMVALGAAILLCSSAYAQNLFVSGRDARGGEIFQFTWDGAQSIFASGLYKPWDMAIDSAGNVFVVDYIILGGDLVGNGAIFKITPNGMLSIFASRVSYASSLAVDKAGNLFVADYDNGIIYEYKPDGSRATFASGLNHPLGMALDSAGNLFVADNNIGNIYQGGIYKYKPDGSRVTIAVLHPGDRPSDLALDSMGNLYMADLGSKIYRYDLSGVLRRYPRTTFGSVPNSAQSLAFDSAGNLFVVDAGGVNGTGNAIYKFTAQGARSIFAPAVDDVGESLACLAFQPIPCCE